MHATRIIVILSLSIALSVIAAPVKASIRGRSSGSDKGSSRSSGSDKGSSRSSDSDIGSSRSSSVDILLQSQTPPRRSASPGFRTDSDADNSKDYTSDIRNFRSQKSPFAPSKASFKERFSGSDIGSSRSSSTDILFQSQTSSRRSISPGFSTDSDADNSKEYSSDLQESPFAFGSSPINSDRTDDELMWQIAKLQRQKFKTRNSVIKWPYNRRLHALIVAVHESNLYLGDKRDFYPTDLHNKLVTPAFMPSEPETIWFIRFGAYLTMVHLNQLVMSVAEVEKTMIMLQFTNWILTFLGEDGIDNVVSWGQLTKIAKQMKEKRNLPQESAITIPMRLWSSSKCMEDAPSAQDQPFRCASIAIRVEA